MKIAPKDRFGELTVIELVSGYGNGAQARCRCTCGARVKVPTRELSRRRKFQHCGAAVHQEVAHAS